jgi:hypothetical protein
MPTPCPRQQSPLEKFTRSSPPRFCDAHSSDKSYGKQVGSLPASNRGMCLTFPLQLQLVPTATPQWPWMLNTERSVAICCYTDRVVATQRCQNCRQDYGCPIFRTTAELLLFTALIPPSMLGSPLPLNLWPNLWLTIVSNEHPRSAACGDDEESPVKLLATALGLVFDSGSATSSGAAQAD